jgi:hypothetical protein
MLPRRLLKERVCAWLARLTVLIARGQWLSTLQSRAVARHYGVTSRLMDFSLSPDVAAIFGTHPRGDRDASSERVCLLYALRQERLAELFPLHGSKPNSQGLGLDISFYSVGPVVRISYLAFDRQALEIRNAVAEIQMPGTLTSARSMLRTTLVPSVRRIAAQQGMFVEVSGMDALSALAVWYLLDFASDKWCLRAHSGPVQGLPKLDLFPSDGWLLTAMEKFMGRFGH